MTAAYTPSVVRTIRKNAGLMPRHEIAAALGWTPGQLDNIAAQHRIDLRLFPMRASDSAPTPTYSIRVPLPERRSEHFGVRLRVGDAEKLKAHASARYTPPASLLAQVFEGALARGKVDELANAAKSYRPGDTVGNDEGGT